MKKVLRFEAADTVAVALEELWPGDSVSVNGTDADFPVRDTVPTGHKLALKKVSEGDEIVKYGQVIGRAARGIEPGEYVHTHNLRDIVAEWSENVPLPPGAGQAGEIAEEYRLVDPPRLTGYRRKGGMVGFRNHLLVVSTVVCANQIVQEIGCRYKDVVAVPNPSGCVILPNEVERIKAILLGMACNPNAGAVIFVGLGCESTGAQWFYEQIKEEKPAAFICQQEEGSSTAAFNALEQAVLGLKGQLAQMRREEVSVGDIRLGTKCGGSDWTTAIVSNPAIGVASDLVVKNGGISLLGETSGWFGAEGVLTKRARDAGVAEGIMHLLGNVYQRALSMGRRIEEGNPTPGNMEGGISTLCEKALGNVKKGGTAPVEGVLAVGELPGGKGLYVADNPGLDPASLLGLTCSSANLILFSTGRGTPTGTPLAPAVKLTGSPHAASVFGAHMDVDLSPVVAGAFGIEEAGRLLFRELIEVANGKETIAERLGHREFTFPLLMGPL